MQDTDKLFPVGKTVAKPLEITSVGGEQHLRISFTDNTQMTFKFSVEGYLLTIGEGKVDVKPQTTLSVYT